MKWYSRPSCSWPRGLRVVWEIDTTRCESISSSDLTRLDLPAPLGAATTKRFPGYSITLGFEPAHRVTASGVMSISGRPEVSPLWILRARTDLSNEATPDETGRARAGGARSASNVRSDLVRRSSVAI